MVSAHGPWIDLHAHAGRCFLAGLDDADPLAGFLGGQDVVHAISLAADAGLAAITLATVADLRVLTQDRDKGLRASRPFLPGEANADHRRQLDGIGRMVAAAGRADRSLSRRRRGCLRCGADCGPGLL